MVIRLKPSKDSRGVSLLFYLPSAMRRRDGFMLFPTALV